MNILHYSIGLYPDRQGGLSRYSTDLALEQSKTEHVFFLMPGKLGIIDKKVRIVKVKTQRNFEVFKIDNAFPIPVYSGIKDIDLYTKRVDYSVYKDFLKSKEINIIHIHSIMGLHIELLIAAKDLEIPILMTTHDFFGLCPITSLFKDGKVCDCDAISDICSLCCQKAHSYNKLAIGQTKLYRKFKNKSILGLMRKKVLADNSSVTEVHNENLRLENNLNYNKLDKYYKECFSLIDYYLFNSTQTRSVFESRLGNAPGKVIHLLLPSIDDKRKKREFLKDGKLHIGYMGECKEFKGFFVLKNAVEQLALEGYKVELDVFNDSVVESDLVIRCGKYTSNQLVSIYDKLDLIVVPSIIYETLSFVALEAISSGMPCLISDHVGVKDLIIQEETGLIVEAGNVDKLKNEIKKILDNEFLLREINSNICKSNSFCFSFLKHSNAIISIYNAFINEYSEKKNEFGKK